MAEPPGDNRTIWELKASVEEQFPDFPNIDVTAPDFNLNDYLDQSYAMIHALGVPDVPVSLSWHHLTSTVPVEPPEAAIKTFTSAFDDIAYAVRNGIRKANHKHNVSPEEQEPSSGAVPESFEILSGVSGVVEEGSMCLVLGPSGSGSTVLLSRIAGRDLGSEVVQKGTVRYNGQERLYDILRPSHFLQYIGQRDEHIPQLTVRDTLEFAAQCKWPDWMPHVEAVRRNDVLLIAKTLRIERTLDTIVGSDILRGVSGGERKRVTIAEMLIGMNGRAVVMDNWSKGLDASTTLSITKAMREFVDEKKCAVIASMQAPSTATFNLFDTVCVLDQGRVVYFGPRERAEPYFLGLGFQRPPQRSIPDFIATVTDPEVRKEYIPSDVSESESAEGQPRPETSEEFAVRFEESKVAEALNDRLCNFPKEPSEMDDDDYPDALMQTGKRSSLQRARHQMRAVAKRQVRLYIATRGAIAADLIQLLIMGVVLGSIFWQLPDTLGGARSRGGLLFLGLLFMGLSALAKITEKHDAKPVFLKQRNASFYDAWTFIVTLTLFDVLMELLRTICFIVPLYLMSGLSLGDSGQRLLYAVLLVTQLSLIMISITRTLVALFDDADSAQGAEGLITMILILFAGYLKQPDILEGWLKWIYWINPIHYVYEALVVNEYDGLTFKCETEELIPKNGNVPNENRVCPASTGELYLESPLGLSIDEDYRLYYFLVTTGFIVLLVVVSILATALTKAKGHALKWNLSNGSVIEKDASLDATIIDVTAPEVRKGEATRFTFTDVKYSVDNGKKVLLNGIRGHSVGGKVVLLMGESGAGKSTLLDVCAMRKTLKKGTSMEGSVRINGRVVSKDLISRYTGYCEQNDLHIAESTVKEAIVFSAKLRLPDSLTNSEKKSRAMETIDLLGLTPFSEVLVKDLGSGELKLLTMALEVVADPIVLFLDEPTSGLSASSTLVVANALRKIADKGTSVVCTIHQPSPEVFGMFDQLLLLKRGGRQVYFGDIGVAGSSITRYFLAKGAPDIGQDENPADWMLDVIADETKDYVEEWTMSEEKGVLDRELETLQHENGDSDEVSKPFKKVGFLLQLKAVTQRFFVRYWRLPEYNFTKVVLMLMLAVLVGLLYLREIDNSQQGARLAFAALFLSVIPSSLYAQNVIPPTASGRAVFYREVASGTYKPLAFHIALGSVEIPFTAVSAAVFSVVFYFMVGLDPSRFGYFFLATQLLHYFSVVLGIFLASVTADPALAIMMASSCTSIFNVLSGFFIQKDQMPSWWRWSTWVNPFFYYLAGVVQNQMEDRDFTCKPSELGLFELPDGYTSCDAIPGGDFAPGGIVDGVTQCTFCPVADGDQLIRQFGADDVDKWLCLVALLVAISVCRVLAGFGFSKLRFLSR